MDSQTTPRRIAVVDDDHDIRKMLRMVLELSGYEVIAAQNGQDALAQLRGGPPVSMIILDLKMPVMNGWQFREAQLNDTQLRDVPVLLLSGDAGLSEASASLGAPYLDKPVDIDALLRAVEATVAPRAAPP